ncbi:MAG: 2,3-bisphosphoglycerate-dependent phosphoglycerate mutase [Chlamydiota bacterium]
MAKLILLRHGQSAWNQRNLFTGWVDVPLSKQGIQEAFHAGKQFAHIPIDVIFVSSLIRSHMTAFLAMSVHDADKVPYMLHTGEGRLEEWGRIHSKEAQDHCIPVIAAWELNERMYGALQGLNKQETMDQYGEAQVKIWRRSFDCAPPVGESLAMTAERTLPFFKEKILSRLEKGENVLISAHGNSLRAIVMYLENLSKEAVVELEIATGVPLFYNYDQGVCYRSI